MSHLVILPTILWTIEKLPTACKFSSSVVTFMGMKWKLTLIHFPDISLTPVNKYQLTLERISPVPNSTVKNIRLSTSTTITFTNGNPVLQKGGYVTVSNQYWCIWASTLQDIIKNFSNALHSQCTFSISVTLSNPTSSQLQSISYATEEQDARIPWWMASLGDDLEKLLIDGNMHSDVAFKCEDKIFCAHRAILAARSEVFAAMFHTNMKEAEEGVVHITDMEPYVLRQFLSCLYTGKFPALSTESVRQLHAAADKYGIEALQIQCGLFIAEKYTEDNESYSEEVIKDDSDNQMEEIPSKDMLLKDLFQTLEWKTLAESYPKLTSEMCRPLLMYDS